MWLTEEERTAIRGLPHMSRNIAKTIDKMVNELRSVYYHEDVNEDWNEAEVRMTSMYMPYRMLE